MQREEPHNVEEQELTQKVAFLRQASSYPHRPARVEETETHMSWVFLAGDRVYKLKKPIRYTYFDFTTLAAREHNCHEEVRLNARLAPDVYLGVTALHRDANGNLTFADDGPVVEWLVTMKRLPADRMLDSLISVGNVRTADIDVVARALITFYGTSPPVPVSTDEVMDRFAAEHAEDARLLTDSRFAIDHDTTATVLARMKDALMRVRPLIGQRIADNVYRDCHGDLRPEHICLVGKPVFIDCLEFSRDLRILDPFDELAFLDLECERLGAGWIGKRVIELSESALAHPAPPALRSFYRAARGLLRARLAIAHLMEAHPRTPAKWEPRARSYVNLASAALDVMDETGGAGRG